MDMSNIECVNCAHSTHVIDAKYCQNCGIELFNHCTNETCRSHDEEIDFIPYGAKFCPYCGSKSSHFDYLNKPED